MKSRIFLLMTGALIAINMNAQNVTTGSSEDSARWLLNINLFDPLARAGNFKEAYPYWKILYDECPNYHRNLYIHGVNIINWKISEETDEAKRDELIDELMTLYDNRIKYFGDLPNMGKDRIIANKAQAYNQHKGEKTDYAVIHQWTGDVIREFGEKTTQSAIALYMFASLKMMQNDMEQYKEQYVTDFLQCSDLFDAHIAAAKAANNTTEENEAIAHKSEIERMFATSGAADCDILQSIYVPKIKENKDNLNFLNETLLLLRRVGCRESDAFIAASEFAHAIAPTAESAQGLGYKAFKENDNATAEKYFNQALELSDDPESKGDLYFAMAIMAINQNNYIKTKQLCLKSIAEKPNNGGAYILIGKAYAQSARNYVPDDPVLSSCVYIAAVDKVEKARQVDPSVAEEARKLIAAWTPYFPSGGDIFMHPNIKEGENYTLGGWIGETVKVRAAK